MKLPTLKPRLQVLKTAGIRPQETERLRGRAGVDRRARWLRAHPLCEHCKAQGLVTEATTPDHIIPCWKGGRDDESNLQSLCEPCHHIKTKAEAAERARGG